MSVENLAPWFRSQCCEFSGLTPRQLDKHARFIADRVIKARSNPELFWVLEARATRHAALEATPVKPPLVSAGVASSAAVSEPHTGRPVAPSVSARPNLERLATTGPSGTTALK